VSKVFIQSIADTGIEPGDLFQAFTWLNWETLVPRDARVFVKPNLTWPVHLPGVTTTPQMLESLVQVLLSRTKNIAIGESDGGYHSFKAEEAFKGHNLFHLRDKYGISLVNLSDFPSEHIKGTIAGRETQVKLPSLLLHDIDVFITVPVPKTHVMTGVSLGFKNQWGCTPSTMRLREHYDFDRKIVLINKLLKPRLTIMDGTYFLDGAGPMTGDAIPLSLLIVGDDVGATSKITCEIMGIQASKIRHFKVAGQESLFPQTFSQIVTNTEFVKYKTHQFIMKRAFLDWISLIGFRSKLFTKIFYDSRFAGPLHQLLFLVRKNPILEHLLYGKAGTPPSYVAGK
jgi:uncharacterized protein (DUF362 family)